MSGRQCRDVSVWGLTLPSGRVERRERGGPEGEAQERRVLTRQEADSAGGRVLAVALGAQQHVDGAGAAVDGSGGGEGHHVEVPSQP